jgi:hypothetical protein
MSTEYRILGPDEIIEKGDEISYTNVNFWVNCRTTIGDKVGDNTGFEFRRPIKKDESYG